MKKKFILSLILILLVPCLGFSDLATFRVGYFIPRADSELWITELENMDFSKSDFTNSNFGFSYEYFFSKQISFAISVDGYTRKKVGSYLDYVGIEFLEGDFAFPSDFEGDFAISHVFDVSITPIQLSLKLVPLGRIGKFIPYVGGGVGVYLWNVRLQGDIVDFEDVWEYTDDGFIVEVYAVKLADAREDNKIKIGYHAFGGLMFPVANRISIEAEIKYNFVEGALTEGFEGFEDFDLSGYQISIGLNYWF